MKHWIEMTADGLRILSFWFLLGLATIAVAPLIGCEQKPPASDSNAPADKDIKINAPGVDVEVDRTPNADGSNDVDVNVNPGGTPGVDVDVDKK